MYKWAAPTEDSLLMSERTLHGATCVRAGGMVMRVEIAHRVNQARDKIVTSF